MARRARNSAIERFLAPFQAILDDDARLEAILRRTNRPRGAVSVVSSDLTGERYEGRLHAKAGN